jgi:hypothetical protein
MQTWIFYDESGVSPHKRPGTGEYCCFVSERFVVATWSPKLTISGIQERMHALESLTTKQGCPRFKRNQ